jgi:hypothetical protein
VLTSAGLIDLQALPAPDGGNSESADTRRRSIGDRRGVLVHDPFSELCQSVPLNRRDNATPSIPARRLIEIWEIWPVHIGGCAGYSGCCFAALSIAAIAARAT